jgi:pterin-4a-carbinolamine dehydratase
VLRGGGLGAGAQLGGGDPERQAVRLALRNPFTDEENDMTTQIRWLEGWTEVERPPSLYRRFEFADYSETRAFLNRLASLSKETGLDPDLSFTRTHVTESSRRAPRRSLAWRQLDMTPVKGPSTPASQGPKRPRVPDVPTAPPVRSAKTNDDTQLLGPEGEPLALEAASGDAGGDSAPPQQTGDVDPQGPVTQSRRRPGGLYPLPVWPD